jgi:hypothetical protein
MEKIEKYIIENREKFNQGEMPNGHKERFLKKLSNAGNPEEREQGIFRNNIRRPNNKTMSLFIKIALPLAAVFVVGISIIFFHKSAPSIEVIPQMEIAEMKEMEELEQQIDKLSKQNDTITQIQTRNAVNSITFEAIPMNQQLPKVISPTERARILKNYYKQKVEGLKKVKTFLAEQCNTEIANDETMNN